ncbi:hypothetical protein VB780_12805 [Leptolyngbya sp. CCNP1308]|uniref:hypothetical protein n=1 Tax=Leptolyngbya sp. CCNP1308 TaxID=3110255 RepID=UPI002B20C39D|nr:hypothetical protein [Leptolyngbya sp. CCNP1308]MEA5449456.1 hypothetical protein [Leptolyngbya sp. CCNP1308]
MKINRLIAVVLTTAIVSASNQDGGYAQNPSVDIVGDCNVAVIGNTNVVEAVTCYLNTELPEVPRPVSDPSNPVSVIQGGQWWAQYYDQDFGALRGYGMFPGQFPNDSSLGYVWGRNSRPPMFPQGAGVLFSAKIYGRRNFDNGVYCFSVTQKRGNYTKVFVNDSLVLSDWYPEPGGYPKNCLNFRRGVYSIKVEYKSTGGGAKLDVRWRRQR